MRQKLLAGLGLVVVASLLVGCAGYGYTARKHHGGYGSDSQYGHHGKHRNLEKKFFKKAHIILSHGSALELTEDQVDTIKNLKLETRKGLIQYTAEIEVAALEIKAALKADNVDSRQVNQLIDKKYGAKTEKAKMLASAYIKLKGTLSSAQMEKLKGLWKGKGKKECSKSKCSSCR